LKKRVTFLFLLTLFPLFFIFSQDELPSEFSDVNETEEHPQGNFEVQIQDDTAAIQIPETAIETVSEYEAGAVFIINSFNFNITGITRKFALINKGELEEGEVITGFSNLEKYIKEKQQLLYNERALQSVSIDYFIGQKGKDGKYPVDLEITTRDSWNIIALPKPQYSSNSGFKLTVNYRDYNFLGTLMPLRFDIGYRYSEKNRNYFSFMLDTDTPFVFLKFNWNLIFYNSIDVSPNLEKKFIYKNVTGFQVQLPLKKTVFLVGFRESLFVNQEHDDGDKEAYGDNQKGLYFSSNPFINWNIPTGVEAGKFGQIHYVPTFSANINHELPPWPLDDIKDEKTISWGHSLSFGRIDWIEDLRNGLSFNISNSYNYSFRRKRLNEEHPLEISYQLSVTSHNIIKKDRLGFSTRFFLRHWLFNTNDAGDVLRGIRDNQLQANFMMSLNLDFPVKVLEARPDEWFGVSQFRIFNFDFYLSPILDAAIYHHPNHQTVIGFRNFLFTGGLEAIFFPLRMRSMHLRMSMGLNLSRLSPFGELSPNLIPGGYDPSSANKYEIYIGTDFHF
jgi:hypothetical protein